MTKTIKCVICDKTFDSFECTNPDGLKIILDTYPVCEQCIAELLYMGLDLEELI